jgi:hypothetical protein
MSERPQDPELTAVEAALRDLRPRPEALDRAVLMYRAGRASARGRLWPAATALASAVALVLGIVLLLRPAPPVVERVVYLPAPAEGGRGEPADHAPQTPRDGGDGGSWSSYVHLQEEVLDRGLDGLPPPPAAPEQPPSVESLLRSF